MQLEVLGWNEFFAAQPCPGVPGRVAAAARDCFSVWTEAGEVEAFPSGSLRRGTAWPAVGDWIALRRETPVIEHVFERRTLLSRKQAGRAIGEQALAANIDVLFIVSGVDGDYNERRLERYLVVARQSGARPVFLLNKADLAEIQGFDLPQAVEQLGGSAGVPVLPVSALTGEGLGALAEYLRAGETAALIGSSGVGKSTIVNRLLDREIQLTRDIRADDGRGRHTTTTRSMFLMPSGWLLIDMPGLREIQLWASPDLLDAGFDDIRDLAAGCRFRDCTHSAEPGCAVVAACVDPGRLENYHKLRRELDYLDRKADKRLMSESQARWKAIHKSMRHIGKDSW